MKAAASRSGDPVRLPFRPVHAVHAGYTRPIQVLLLETPILVRLIRPGGHDREPRNPRIRKERILRAYPGGIVDFGADIPTGDLRLKIEDN